MNTIRVNIPAVKESTYEVRVGPGLLGALGPTVRSLCPAPTCAIISDSNVAPHYLGHARQSLASAGFRIIEHIIPAGEQHKNLNTAIHGITALLSAKIERATPVVALGGGVVGDLTGFVAATTLRGLPFVQVPTTLLAAVDASVGGKVGVDHPEGKNLIGAFHQPKIVLTDISTFKTLPARELRSGLAECIKHAVIRDASLFDFVGNNVAKIQSCDPATLTELVSRNVAIKAAIVHEDPYEKSVRALLNFGHTFGHAIENVLHYTGVTHGEAVALGMVAASKLSHGRGQKGAADGFAQEELKRLVELIDYVGLPTCQLDLDSDKVIAAMATDKKVQAGKLRFILPTKIGHAKVVSDVMADEIRSALSCLLNPVVGEQRQGQ